MRRCSAVGGPHLSCIFEVVLIATLALLAISELFQLIVLRFQYFREFENILEISVISLAVTGLVFQVIRSSFPRLHKVGGTNNNTIAVKNIRT